MLLPLRMGGQLQLSDGLGGLGAYYPGQAHRIFFIPDASLTMDKELPHFSEGQ